MTVSFLLRYSDRPMQFFGSAAINCLVLAAIFLICGIYIAKFFDLFFIAFFIAALLVSISIISVLIGFSSELIIRAYYESSGRKIYYTENL